MNPQWLFVVGDFIAKERPIRDLEKFTTSDRQKINSIEFSFSKLRDNKPPNSENYN
jgi:hypothetical protein